MAFEVAGGLQAGVVWQNTYNHFDPTAAFGGYKESGIGREHGPYAIDEYLLDKTISIDPSQDVPEEVLNSVQPAPAHA